MSLSVPESTLTSDELARIASFNRSDADALDEALVEDGVGSVPYIDLSLAPYFVTAGDDSTAVAQANTAAINLAIASYGIIGGARLVLPGGDVYIEQAAGGVAWSILFGQGISGIDLSGQGPNETRLIQNGVGDGGDWHAILFDRCSSCGIHDFHIEMGIVKRPDQIQINHLVNITNSSLDGTGTTQDIYGYNLSFGKTVGDQLRIFGDTAPIVNVKLYNLTLRGNGICIQNWTATTAYVAGEWVRHDSGKNYLCIQSGISGGLGPSGTSSSIIDGTCLWDYKVPREGARTCISIQRGYRNVDIGNFYAIGAQNGILDAEPTAAGGMFAGAEVMEFLHVHDGTLDNSLSDTAVAATFSGITAGTKSYGNTLSNIDIIAGCLSMIQTDTQTIENVTISVKTALPDQPSFPNILARQSNVNLTMTGITLIRGGTAGNGNLIDVELADRMTIDGFDLQQGTVGYPIILEATPKPNIRNGRIHWTAGTPSARSAVYLAAINADVDNAVVDNVSISTSSTKMLAAVELISRTTLKIRNVSITNISAAGFVTTGVFMSIQGTPGDVNPIIQGCSFGTDPTWVSESEVASTPITTVFPIVAGSKGANTARHLEGNVTPGGNCVGNLGDIYTWRPTTTTAQMYVKESQSVAGTPDNGGWTLK